jgi:hypothetical protein
MLAMYHLSHLIAADLGRERAAARHPRPRRGPVSVLRGARIWRRAPQYLSARSL